MNKYNKSLLFISLAAWLIASQSVNSSCQGFVPKKSHFQTQIFKLTNLTQEEKKEREVYAVEGGFPVSWSSVNPNHQNYRLGYNGNGFQCWQSGSIQKGEWIQVSQETPKFWTEVIIQGRGEIDEWVTEVKISYSLNGKQWYFLEEDKVYPANCDRHQKVSIKLSYPVYGRMIRIHPVSWHNRISLRFEAIYIDLQ